MTEFAVKVTATDGSTYSTKVQLFPGSGPVDARDLIWLGLEECGWRGRTPAKDILILQGLKKAGVCSVEFTSEIWAPTARWVPVAPPKK